MYKGSSVRSILPHMFQADLRRRQSMARAALGLGIGLPMLGVVGKVLSDPAYAPLHEAIAPAGYGEGATYAPSAIPASVPPLPGPSLPAYEDPYLP